MTMAPWSVKAASLVLLLLLLVAEEPATALDVQIVNVTCDESLPVTADVYLQCEGGGKCTFGEEASVYGSCTCVLLLCAAWLEILFHPWCY
jgi:hypothetical protein